VQDRSTQRRDGLLRVAASFNGSVKPTPTGCASWFPPRFALRCGLPYELGFSFPHIVVKCLLSFCLARWETKSVFAGPTCV
jgi:hypothetical protein